MTLKMTLAICKSIAKSISSESKPNCFFINSLMMWIFSSCNYHEKTYYCHCGSYCNNNICNNINSEDDVLSMQAHQLFYACTDNITAGSTACMIYDCAVIIIIIQPLNYGRHIRKIWYKQSDMYSQATAAIIYLYMSKSCLHKNGMLLVNNMTGHNFYGKYLQSPKHKMAKLYRCLHALC